MIVTQAAGTSIAAAVSQLCVHASGKVCRLKGRERDTLSQQDSCEGKWDADQECQAGV